MSAIASAPQAARPRTASRGTARPVTSQGVRTARFAIASIGAVLRKGMFIFFTVAMPIGMFLLFNGIYGRDLDGDASRQIMVGMAAYGGLGAALNAGSIIQLERANGWLRQLMVAGLTPRAFVIGKLVAGMVVVLPAIVGVMLTGLIVASAAITVTHFVLTVVALAIAMIPMLLLGLVIGLALPPSAVSPATTIGMMVLAVLGGLWFPLEMFPSWMVSLSKDIPTYWIGEIGRQVAAGHAVPGQAIAVIAVWSVALAVLAALLLRRGARTTSRR